MLNPAEFGLTQNPFSLVPGTGVEHWAGMPKMKKAMTEIVTCVRPDDVGASEFVILHGKFGAGKTHALEHFAHKINGEKDGGRAIYMGELVDGTGLSFSGLHRRILEEQIEGDALVRLSRNVKDSVQTVIDQMSAQMQTGVIDDLAIQKVVAPRDRPMVKSLNKAGRVLPSGKGDLAAAKGLASLFRVMTSPIGDNKPCYGAVYLFLDEVEAVLHDVKMPMQAAFFSSLRALINEVPEHFALILSCTEEAAALEALLPTYLQERRTRSNIECGDLSLDGAKDFVRDYLKGVRPSGYSPPQPFHPFKEEAIVDAIFERESTMIPRRIIKNMLRVWERASRDNLLRPGEEITREMADEILANFV